MTRNRLYATAWNILNDHDDAEDAVQGTFLSLLARGIDPERAPLQLLLVAVRRRALDMVRQRQTRSELIRSNNYQRPRSIEWDPELIDAKATYAAATMPRPTITAHQSSFESMRRHQTASGART